MSKNFESFLYYLGKLIQNDEQHLDVNAKLVCFQLIHDTEKRALDPIFFPIDLEDMDATQDALSELYTNLKKRNDSGYGVYWSVNEFGHNMYVQNLPPTEIQDWKRLASNVTRIRSLFVDIDYYLSKDDINVIVDKFKPTLTILTSTKDDKFKSHFYWIFEKNEFPLLDNFSQLQKVLAYKIEDFVNTEILESDGNKVTDKQIIDPSRLLRVPYFYHKKGEDFLVDVFYESPDYYEQTEKGVNYLLSDIFEITPDYIEYVDELEKSKISDSVQSFLNERNIAPVKNALQNLQEGERNSAVYNYALKLFRNGLSLVGTLGAIKESNLEMDNPIEDEKEIENTVLSAWNMFEKSCTLREYMRSEAGVLGNNPGEIFATAFKTTLKNKLAEITPEELAKWEAVKKETEEKLEESIGQLYEYDYVDGVQGTGFMVFADPLSEASLVERLKQQFGDIIKYDPEIGFIIYNVASGNWEESPKRSENLLANFLTEIAMLAPYEKETIKRAKLYKDGRADLDKISREVGKLTSSSNIASLIKKTSQDSWFSCRKDKDFNQHKHLLNCQNGIIDLQTGKLHAHQARYMMTQQANFAYTPENTKDLESKEDWKKTNIWTKFVYQVMQGDIELCRYLQEIMGYAITGETSEQCCFFFYGNGRNGKSLFLNTIMDVVRDYSAIISSKALAHTEKLDNNVLYALYSLLGARYVKSDEITERQVWDEALLKSFSGEDYISARPPRGSYIEFKPDYKLFFQGNHKPRITGVDEGAWRRLRIVEWGLNLQEHEVDKALGKKFLTEDIGSQILSWLVDGAKRFYAQGEVYTPEVIWEEVENYRQEIDPYRSWIKDCLEIHTDFEVCSTIEELIECYAVWVKDSGIDTDTKVVSLNSLSNQSKTLKEKQVVGKALTNHGIKSRVIRGKDDKSERVYPVRINATWLSKIKEIKEKKKKV